MDDRPTEEARDLVEELFGANPGRVTLSVSRALTLDASPVALPGSLPDLGLDPDDALARVVPHLRAGDQNGGRDLGDPGFFAHMDPPTPWVTWVAALIGASTNQNLLHPDTAPMARDLEQRVVGWLAAPFGMDGGHLVPGSSVANLTALWAARDKAGVDTVVASGDAHLSVAKAARILGIDLITVAPDPDTGAMTAAAVSEAVAGIDGPVAVVLTAGTTGRGAIDDLTPGSARDRGAGPGIAWVHVDAAWAGPLGWSSRYRDRLAGIERADSMALSGHKWLFQPKESAAVLFRETAIANEVISLGGAYLQVPNVGVQGSHGTAAAPLAATLLSLGEAGLARLVDRSMNLADRLEARIDAEPTLERLGRHRTGVVVWRHLDRTSAEVRDRLDGAFVSSVRVDGRSGGHEGPGGPEARTDWLRSVAANPMADPDLVVDRVLVAAAG